MDEDQIYDDYLEQSSENMFPAYRYWRDGEIIGDTLDIFISVNYGDPEVIGVYEEDDHWVVTIQKDGVEQEKKFLMMELEVPEGGIFIGSEHPSDDEIEVETDMSPGVPAELPDIPSEGETPMEPGTSVLPDIDDSADVQVDSGEDNVEVDLGVDLESEGSIEDLIIGQLDILLDSDG